MESTVHAPYELIRPWRRATLVAGAIAVVELVALAALATIVLDRPVVHAGRSATHPRHTASTAPRPTRAARLRTPAIPVASLPPRRRLEILVLNGNGRTGAAAGAAANLRSLGYRIAGIANATRQNYATTLVMYRPGYRRDGLRLARDLRVRVVGPLDGMRPAALLGGQLAVILGG